LERLLKMENIGTAIKTEQLTKYFGQRKAVDGIDIEIRKGEVYSLLGTNGAGKTTTIKMLCCLLQPTSGRAEVMGLDISENPLKIKGMIGVSPQETAIAGHLNTRENLELMGGVFGLTTRVSKERANTLMGLLELEDRKDQARKLSGGLQRRLSIAMALMSDPQLLFLDEPTLGLDPHARRSVWNYIGKLKTEKTILLTTHYLEEADSLADTIAIMDKGRIIETGTSAELKQRYNSKKVLRIKGENIPSDMSELISSLGYETRLNSKVIEIGAAEIDFYKVIDLLKLNGVSIQSIEMKEPTLDDVFLNLTQKGETK